MGNEGGQLQFRKSRAIVIQEKNGIVHHVYAASMRDS